MTTATPPAAHLAMSMPGPASTAPDQPAPELLAPRISFPGLLTDLIRLPRVDLRSDSPVYQLNKDEQRERYNAAVEAAKHRETFKAANLTPLQSRVFRWGAGRPNNLALLQAGPGCGKSYVMNVLAGHLGGDAVIYKNDLLAPYRFVARRFTVARLGMAMYRVDFIPWTGVEKSMSRNFTPFEFIIVMTALIRHATLPNFAGGFVIIDEYTIMPKPLLVVLLTLLEYHRIGGVVCGDRNQLQNIYNSQHAQVPAYDIARLFVPPERQFLLVENRRCTDVEFGAIIEMLAEYTTELSIRECDAPVAIVAATFYRQLYGRHQYSDVHLASRHKNLAWTTHCEVGVEELVHEYYYVDVNQSPRRHEFASVTGCFEPPITLAFRAWLRDTQANLRPAWDFRFLPYLPLRVGARYYAYRYSDFNRCTLVRIVYSNAELHPFVTSDGKLVLAKPPPLADLVSESYAEAARADAAPVPAPAPAATPSDEPDAPPPAYTSLHRYDPVDKDAAIPLEEPYPDQRIEYTADGGPREISYLVVKLLMPPPGQDPYVVVTRDNCAPVMFKDHLKYVKQDGRTVIGPDNNYDKLTQLPGALVNFPLYPATARSLYQIQGSTIDDDQTVSINLSHATCRGLYVAISRVRSRDQIVHVTVDDDLLDFKLSTPLNFPQLIANPETVITRADIDAVLPRYVRYKLDVDRMKYHPDLMRAVTKSDVDEWLYEMAYSPDLDIRMHRLGLVQKVVTVQGRLKVGPRTSPKDEVLIAKFARYRELFLALASVSDVRDRNVWLHEWFRACPEFDTGGMSKEQYRQHDACAMQDLLRGQQPPPPAEQASESSGQASTATTLECIADLPTLPSMATPAVRYISQYAKVVTYPDHPATRDEPVRLTECQIAYRPPNTFRETTPFCARVYRRYKAWYKQHCDHGDFANVPNEYTREQLIDELNTLLEQGAAAVDGAADKDKDTNAAATTDMDADTAAAASSGRSSYKQRGRSNAAAASSSSGPPNDVRKQPRRKPAPYDSSSRGRRFR